MNSSPNIFASRPVTDSSALNQLTATVKRLVRAETRQALTHFGYAGLFWGISAACVAVIAIRLWPLAVSIAYAIITCVFTGPIIGLAIGWNTRRSPRAVAILADIRLELKQRLSSAWELYENDPQSATAAGISRQLLKFRTPVAERVFPLTHKSGNAEFAHPGIRWGRLLPAIALMLLLLNTLDFDRFAGQRAGKIDGDVQREGETLRTYGESLALRARNENLEASGQIAETMRQLGRRMEGGRLARGPALERLNELRRDIDNVRQRLMPGNGNTVSENDHSRARSVIENAVNELVNGVVSPSELDENTSLKRALVTANINQQAFRKALEDAHNGDPQDLEKMLAELRNSEDAARNADKDAQELERAFERVQSIRENLGAQAEPGSTAPSANVRGSQTVDDFAQEDSDLLPGENNDASGVVFTDRGRPGGRKSAPDNSQTDVATAAAEENQPAVRPKGKTGEGQEIATQTRIAPGSGEVTTPLRVTDTQQQQQLEAILSKDTLPAHQKAYIRRYFLELSRAVSATPVVEVVEESGVNEADAVVPSE